MKNTNSTQCENDGNRKNSFPSKPTYFVGSWLRDFILSNYQLVGKTFMMKNCCICIDMVYDLEDSHDSSVVYRITDTDLAIRAVFTAQSLLISNHSSGSESEDFSASKLTRSPIILEECRLIHLTIPGKAYGDFVLEVHNFTWEPSKRILKREVDEFLYLDQYIWCSEDPQLQEVLKTVFEKRGGGILSCYTVTNCLDLLLEELGQNQTTKNNLFIPPEIAERFGLNNPGSYKRENEIPCEQDSLGDCTPKKRKILESLDANVQSEVTTPNEDSRNITKPIECPVNVAQQNNAHLDKPLETPINIPASAAKICAIPQTVQVGDSCCNSVQLQPKVKLKRLSETEVSSLISSLKTPMKSTFFLDSIRTKKTLPKWIPKTLKETSPKFRKLKKSLEREKSLPVCIAKLVPFDLDKHSFDPLLQTASTASEVSYPEDSLQVLLSENDVDNVSVNLYCEPDYSYYGHPSELVSTVYDVPLDRATTAGNSVYPKIPSKNKCSQFAKLHPTKAITTNQNALNKKQEMFGSIYQDAFSQWINKSSKNKQRSVNKSPFSNAKRVRERNNGVITPKIISSRTITDNTWKESIINSVNHQKSKLSSSTATDDADDVEILFDSQTSPTQEETTTRNHPHKPTIHSSHCAEEGVSAENYPAIVSALKLAGLQSPSACSSEEGNTLSTGSSLSEPVQTGSTVTNRILVEPDDSHETEVQVFVPPSPVKELSSSATNLATCVSEHKSQAQTDKGPPETIQGTSTEQNSHLPVTDGTSNTKCLGSATETSEPFESRSRRHESAVEDIYCTCDQWQFPNSLMAQILMSVQRKCT